MGHKGTDLEGLGHNTGVEWMQYGNPDTHSATHGGVMHTRPVEPPSVSTTHSSQCLTSQGTVGGGGGGYMSPPPPGPPKSHQR